MGYGVCANNYNMDSYLQSQNVYDKYLNFLSRFSRYDSIQYLSSLYDHLNLDMPAISMTLPKQTRKKERRGDRGIEGELEKRNTVDTDNFNAFLSKSISEINGRMYQSLENSREMEGIVNPEEGEGEGKEDEIVERGEEERGEGSEKGESGKIRDVVESEEQRELEESLREQISKSEMDNGKEEEEDPITQQIQTELKQSNQTQQPNTLPQTLQDQPNQPPTQIEALPELNNGQDNPENQQIKQIHEQKPEQDQDRNLGITPFNQGQSQPDITFQRSQGALDHLTQQQEKPRMITRCQSETKLKPNLHPKVPFRMAKTSRIIPPIPLSQREPLAVSVTKKSFSRVFIKKNTQSSSKVRSQEREKKKKQLLANFFNGLEDGEEQNQGKEQEIGENREDIKESDS